jgi:enoyl-CoA hydratase/carnithine racemase
MPEIDDGIPCITGTWTLYELIGRGRTTDLVLSGRMIDAAEALQWGVVSEVVPAEQLAGAAAALAARLGAKPAAAMRLNKQWLRELLISHLPAAEEYAKRAHGEAFSSGEPQRLMADFLAKRAAGRST